MTSAPQSAIRSAAFGQASSTAAIDNLDAIEGAEGRFFSRELRMIVHDLSYIPGGSQGRPAPL